MDNFNKVLSFILGLVVVIVFFAVLTGRISFKNQFPFIVSKTNSMDRSNKTTPTPNLTLTPTPVSSLVVSSKKSSSSTDSKSVTLEDKNSYYGRYQTTNKTINSIPSTGSPTFLLPVFISLLGIGFYLKKKA